MSEPIEFEGRLSLAEALDMHRYQGLLQIGRPVRWLIVVFSTLLAALCSGLMFWSGRVQHVLVTVVIVWLVILFSPLERRWRIKRYYRRHPEKFPATAVRFSDEGISMRSELYASQFKWAMLSLVADTTKGLMFCGEQRRTMFWLPERVFEAESKARLLDMAARQAVQVVRFR